MISRNQADIVPSTPNAPTMKIHGPCSPNTPSALFIQTTAPNSMTSAETDPTMGQGLGSGR